MISIQLLRRSKLALTAFVLHSPRGKLPFLEIDFRLIRCAPRSTPPPEYMVHVRSCCGIFSRLCVRARRVSVSAHELWRSRPWRAQRLPVGACAGCSLRAKPCLLPLPKPHWWLYLYPYHHAIESSLKWLGVLGSRERTTPPRPCLHALLCSCSWAAATCVRGCPCLQGIMVSLKLQKRLAASVLKVGSSVHVILWACCLHERASCDGKTCEWKRGTG